MILIKIIAILITTGAGLLQIGLEHKWHDKRTKKHKTIRSFLLLLMIVGFLSASILVVYDDRQSELQVRTLTDLKDNAEKATKDSEKRELKAVEDRERIKEELEELQTRIKPVIKLATKKYPTLDINSALVKLADDVQDLQKQNEELRKITKDLAERDYFHPLNSMTKSIVVQRLNQIISSASNREIQITIVSESGNTNRQKVARQLVEILSECGFKTTGPSAAMTFSRGVLPAVRIAVNPADEDIARQLAFALNPYLNVRFSGKAKNDNEQGKISIAIYGDPIFSDDGVVTFP